MLLLPVVCAQACEAWGVAFAQVCAAQGAAGTQDTRILASAEKPSCSSAFTSPVSMWALRGERGGGRGGGRD